MKILIVVDYQNDFIDGTLGTKEAQAIYPNIQKKVLEDFDYVLYTQDTHDENYLSSQEGKNLPIIHCQKGSHGWEIPKELLREDAIIIEKNTFGSLELIDTLQKIPTQDLYIEIVGVCTDICVVTNALLLKTAFPEAIIEVDASCCAGLTPSKHEAALETLASCQISIK